ncbi:hypothetical protein FJ941_02790 [Mesorhizobium sp. B2-3-13]|uniref:hypothetical protein n=1 Tax=Mesorhizobium sp. B2-3-13 TaxID=2589951 RepID=UPI001127B65A|nr:hypothetical protein [Mesorhizobium sp. B2-3-13]TPL89746.1 hypothetical protein FJ941_02790 [Mesorhizobium sp. B2-3-13]
MLAEMATEEERKEARQQVKALIDEFSKEHRGEIESILGNAGLPYRTWRRAGQGLSISDVEFNKIVRFLSKNSLVYSKRETGTYTKKVFDGHYGFYNMYRPNSVDSNRIEIFRAGFEWDDSLKVAKVVMQNYGRNRVQFIVYKPEGKFLFLRGAVDGWSSLYALDELGRCRIRGKETKIMTGVCVAMDYTDSYERSLYPVLFPVVLEKMHDVGFADYKEEVAPSVEYERLRELLEIAVRGNKSAVDVWLRFAMPGNANGGPLNP